jgi:hypothetical protein
MSYIAGVIIFASDQEVGELMLAVKRCNATGIFSWIGSDGWGGRALAYEGKEAQVQYKGRCRYSTRGGTGTVHGEVQVQYTGRCR